MNKKRFLTELKLPENHLIKHASGIKDFDKMNMLVDLLLALKIVCHSGMAFSATGINNLVPSI